MTCANPDCNIHEPHVHLAMGNVFLGTEEQRAKLVYGDDLQAQCAAMRRAIIELGHATRLSDMCHDEIEAARAVGDAALAPDAGKALLERLEKAEQELEMAKSMLRYAHEENMVAHIKIRAETSAQALEQAANVAEECTSAAMDDHSIWVGCRNAIAAAIRALKGDGT